MLLGEELLSFINVTVVRGNPEDGVKIVKGSGEELDWRSDFGTENRRKLRGYIVHQCSFQFGLLYQNLEDDLSGFHICTNLVLIEISF